MDLETKLAKLPEVWRNRVIQNTGQFNESDIAKDILIEGYSKVFSIQRSLTALAIRECVKKEDLQSDDVYVKGLAYVLHKRKVNEVAIRNDATRAFKYLTFSYTENINALRLIFEIMPDPNTSSLQTLKGSLMGTLQFPKTYFSRIRGQLAYASQECPSMGIAWDYKEFGNVLNRIINEQTSLTGRTGDSCDIGRMTVPGSYRAGGKNPFSKY
jgi:hypothetical protein